MPATSVTLRIEAIVVSPLADGTRADAVGDARMGTVAAGSRRKLECSLAVRSEPAFRRAA